MRIVFCGGGTAGHVMPAVALIERLKQRAEIHFIGSKTGMEREIIGGVLGVSYHGIDVVKLVRSATPKNLLIPFKLAKSVRQAGAVLKSIQPDVVFSKGGFVALPVTLAAKCPLVCHESDFTVGLANRLVKNKAKFFCTSFPSTATGIKNGVFCGSPVRKSLFRAHVYGRKPVLLVMGGSLGAGAINECLAGAVTQLTAKFDVIHITGRGKSTAIVQDGYTQMEFCADIGALYAKASVVVSRAGGSALFEIAALKIPSVVIPLPKGVSRGDQIDNAKYFSGLGLTRVVFQENLTSQLLIKEVFAALEDEKMRNNLKNASNIDGTDKIVDLILTAAAKT